MKSKLVWRTVFAAVFLLALAVALAGCGGAGGGQGGGSSEGGPSGQIVLYTSEPQENADETVAAFNEQYPEIEVQVFRSGTGELLTRIESEEAAGGGV